MTESRLSTRSKKISTVSLECIFFRVLYALFYTKLDLANSLIVFSLGG